MDFVNAGAVLVAAWVLVYLGCRIARRPMPWHFWLLGGAGCVLFAALGGGRERITWVVLAALCFAVAVFGWLGSRWQRSGQPAGVQPLREEDLERIGDLVNALEGRVLGPQAAYDREASSLKVGLWIAAISAGLGLAAFEWVRTHVRGEVGFGGVIFFAAVALPLMISLAFLVAAIRSLWRMRGLRRRIAAHAPTLPDDNLESGG